jgi:hypothetical protein
MPVRSAPILMVFSVAWLLAADGDRNFLGAWVLDEKQSDLRTLPVAPGLVLTVSQQGSMIHCVESDGTGKSAQRGPTDNTAIKYLLGAERMSSLTKWEGSTPTRSRASSIVRKARLEVKATRRATPVP